jgi:hypothetical protein
LKALYTSILSKIKEINKNSEDPECLDMNEGFLQHSDEYFANLFKENNKLTNKIDTVKFQLGSKL